MARRYFEHSDSNQFWEVWVEQNEVRTRFGEIGAVGETTVKQLGSPEAAQTLSEALGRDRLASGFGEKLSGPMTGAASERVTAPMSDVKLKQK